MKDKPKRLDDIILTRADEESILYDPMKGQIHIFNETGAEIWELCDGELSLDDIAGAISKRFEVDIETARQDVKEFIGELKGLGLLA